MAECTEGHPAVGVGVPPSSVPLTGDSWESWLARSPTQLLSCPRMMWVLGVMHPSSSSWWPRRWEQPAASLFWHFPPSVTAGPCIFPFLIVEFSSSPSAARPSSRGWALGGAGSTAKPALRRRGAPISLRRGQSRRRYLASRLFAQVWATRGLPQRHRQWQKNRAGARPPSSVPAAARLHGLSPAG